MRFGSKAVIMLALAVGAHGLFAQKPFSAIRTKTDSIIRDSSLQLPYRGKKASSCLMLTSIEDDKRSGSGGYVPSRGYEPENDYARIFEAVVDSLASRGIEKGKCVEFADGMINALYDDQKIRAGNGIIGLFADAFKYTQFDCKNFAVFAAECADYFGFSYEYVCLRHHMVLQVDTVYLDLVEGTYYTSRRALEDKHGKVFLTINGKDTCKLKFSSYENLGHMHYYLGQKHIIAGDTAGAAEEYDTARICIQKSLEIAPELPDLWKMLGKIYLALNRLDDALGAYLREAQLDPDSWDVHYRRGNIYCDLKNYKMALKEYEEAKNAGCRFVDKDISRIRQLLVLSTNKK
ncbi:MAG: tetratricopeptide repeat protein [Candidatus Micrarchaeota archaeon]|nr:tetratricopeptide repeat protein [Candidatus Micrarchaeota archaeon]